MDKLNETLIDIANEINNLQDKFEAKNDFGNTIGDELHEMNYYLKSISESLEKIANK